jgi:DNA polymerase-3 subunit gamma/tau
MSYQVLARKWRPQRFDDVIGQQAVTRTLRNAIASGRIAHAFVFAGSRGCGKTTTARILARALNCVNGPTADPCGQCDACLEIAQGRDIDVLEIDAASHTQVDNIREVVLSGLGVAPVRDKYKIFIIDEVHQLSSHSFNALLKSIEEPPAHVVFMMATTELHKIPDTILSRSQVFEFRTIPTKAIAGQLRKIADAEGIDVPDAALALLARAAEGSMRDAQSALDQVIAFAGKTISVDDVSTVLGLVGRDLLFDLADRAVEAGHDLRLLCREVARVVRDLMIVSIDPSRLTDGDIAESEHGRLQQLAGRFSREDLLRAFHVLSQAEQDIRSAAQPRYYFEMMLLRWMHLRKLIPLADLMEQLERGAPSPLSGAGRSAAPTRSVTASASRPAPSPTPSPVRPASGPQTGGPANLKDALLEEIRGTKAFFYNTVVAQAQKIEVAADRVTFSFLPTHRALREQFEQARSWLEVMANRLAGRRVTVVAVQADAPASSTAPPPASAVSGEESGSKRDLKAEALSSTAVQAMLEVFPAEIRDIEEM